MGSGRTYAIFGKDAELVIETRNIFPSKLEAETFYAGKIIMAIKKKRQKLFDELSKWATLQSQYEKLLPKPLIKDGQLPKLPKTWGLVNGQKF